ncbi:MAG: spore coat protein CotJB [Clostridia bacterium]|nr:spore coat protein CotJB [Clostridia bacterium]
MNKEKEKLMKMLQAMDFAIYETALFLDANPKNKRALDYFKKAREMRDQIREQYVEKYGAVNFGTIHGESWDWVETPWPWQYEG